MVSKTFCILPWVHVYANPDGSVLPCCIGDHHKHLGNVQTHSITEIWNNDKFKAMRLKMLAGERCDECSACYRSEDNGVQSFRQTANRDYAKFLNLADKTNPDGSLDSMELKFLDIRWSNICNFKCRSCSGTYSSSWATEDNKHGQNRKVFILAGGENNDKLYNELLPHLGGIQEICFAGGEPLLMDKHYELLEHLIATNNTDIKLRYNSNLSTLNYKQTVVTDYWNKFSQVIVNASLDSWGDRAEYIREGTVWTDVVDNINRIRKDAPKVSLGINSVVSAFNVYTLPEFLDYVFDNKLFSQHCNISMYSIINPDYYSFSILPDKLRAEIIAKLSKAKYSQGVNSQIANVISNLKNSTYSEDLHNKFLIKTDYYDRIRDRSFVKTFPELASIYK